MENTISDMASVNGYEESGAVLWKETDNYLISIFKINDRVVLDIGTGLSGEIMPMAIGEEVALIAERENINDCIIVGASIQLSFMEGELSNTELAELTNHLIGLLQENRILGIEKCQICKRELDNDEKVIIKINNKLLKSHKTCYHKITEDVEEAKNDNSGSYLTGGVGAVLFGALGSLPWIIVGIMGWVVSVFGMVIGISANFGYNLFKGKQGKIKTWIMVAVIVVMVIGAGFVTELYDLFGYIRSEGIEGVRISEASRFLVTILQEDIEYRNSFMLNTAFGLAFGIFGSWRVIKANSGQPEKAKLNIELVK